MKSAKVLLVGAGGLGSPIALYLAAAGVGHIGLIDHDVVSLSNLQRQILFANKDLSLPKVTVAQERLTGLNPEIRIEIFAKKLIASEARSIVKNFDIVIDGSDNFSTRYLVNDACVLENKPLIFGAISRFDAQISVLNWHNGPCYRCLYPQAPPLEAVQNCSEAGVLGVLPGTTGTLMATEALKMILQLGEVLSGQVLTYDSLGMRFFRYPFAKNPECPACAQRQERLLSDSTSGNLGISWVQFEELLRSPSTQVIDVRQPAEFAEKSVRGSCNIPLAELSLSPEKILNRFEQKNLILLCLSGKRSARGVEILTAAGGKQIQHLEGGIHDRDGDHFLSSSP